MGWRAYLATGLATFVAGLVLMTPAPLLQHWLRPKDAPPAFELLGLSGQLRSGTAAGVTVANRPTLNSLQWDLQPLWLLVGRLAAEVRAEADQSLLQAYVAAWPGGRISASDVQFSGDIKSLLAAAGQPYLPIDGMVRISDGRVKLKQGQTTAAEAQIEVQNLAWTLAAAPISLGDFSVQVMTTDAGIQAELSSVSGPLELKGQALLKPDQGYELNLDYRPKAEATPVLRNLLASNGAPDTEGWYHIKQQRQPPALPPKP